MTNARDRAPMAGLDASASICRMTVRNSTSRAASADIAAMAGFDASASRCRMTVRNSTGRTATAARSLRRALRNSDPASAVRLPSGRGVAPSSGFLSADFNPRSASSEVFRMARDQRTWPVISRTSCLNVLHGIRLPQGGVCRAPTTCRRSTLPSPSCQPR